MSDLFDENKQAVKMLISSLIETAHKQGIKVGLCGQAPSGYPEFASFLVSLGIDSVSFNPDALIRGIRNIHRQNRKNLLPRKPHIHMKIDNRDILSRSVPCSAPRAEQQVKPLEELN